MEQEHRYLTTHKSILKRTVGPTYTGRLAREEWGAVGNGIVEKDLFPNLCSFITSRAENKHADAGRPVLARQPHQYGSKYALNTDHHRSPHHSAKYFRGCEHYSIVHHSSTYSKMSDPQSNGAPNITSSLLNTLATLSQNPYPHVPNPASCKKRASVALILRIRPSHAHYPSWSDVASPDPKEPHSTQLENFFAQPWVQHGDPEIVFIKRAAREGDRWTSHVALPGGKRDLEDEDDKATAIRETVEEIGLDLKGSDALFVGNLPERVVSTSWGKVP